MAHGKVFVIDDDDDNLAYLREILSGAEVEVETVSDGARALTLMEAEADRPALVFLDVQMPGLNGFQVLKMMRQMGSLADVPVVLLSAISAVTGDEYDPDTIAEKYGVRPDAFVSKPIDPAKIQEQLARFLDT